MIDDPKTILEKQKPPVMRLLIGGLFFLFGLICPVFIPLILISDFPVALKTILSGLLALGIPELLMIVAIAILGRPGYAYLKSSIFQLFKKYRPPDKIGRLRYRIGIVLFAGPIIIGFLLPYFSNLIPYYLENSLIINISLDIIFLISLLVLGGDFWGKLRSLFIYNSKAVIEKREK